MEKRTQDGERFIEPDDFEYNNSMRMLIDSGAVQLADEELFGFRICTVEGEEILLASRIDDDKEEEE